jgi:hypothetical protein
MCGDHVKDYKYLLYPVAKKRETVLLIDVEKMEDTLESN